MCKVIIMSRNPYLDEGIQKEILLYLQYLLRGNRARESRRSLDESFMNFLSNNKSANLIDLMKVGYVPSSKDQISEDRLIKLERRMEDVYKKVEVIRSILESKESKKEDAILEYKKIVSDIEDILFVYCQQTTEGISLWTIIDTNDMSNTLSQLVQIQIELENKYHDLFFEFFVDPMINKDEINTEDWSPLYRRK